MGNISLERGVIVTLNKKVTNTQVSATGSHREDKGQNKFKEDKKNIMKEKDNVKSD